jgi:hypothetical protein
VAARTASTATGISSTSGCTSWQALGASWTKVRGHQQVAALRAAVLEAELDTRFILLEVDQATAQLEGVVAERYEEGTEQTRTGERDRWRADRAAELAHRPLHHALAVRLVDLLQLHLERKGLDPVAELDLAEGPHRIAPEMEAGAQLLRFGRLLVDGDVGPGAPQSYGSGETADTCSDDGNAISHCGRYSRYDIRELTTASASFA